MRMGVLDIGSNTGHLMVVDAFRGGPPVAAHTFKEPLRLAEHLHGDVLGEDGIEQLLAFCRQARDVVEDQGCVEVMAFATSAVREAANADAVVTRVNQATGFDLQILPGEEEARLTFLAVRRWFGWSSGRLGVFDIGGGSLEIATGTDETPDVAHSLPLGAGRLTREWVAAGRDVDDLRRHVRVEIAQIAGAVRRGGPFDRAVATSKTFRSLARICGAPSSEAGPFVRRTLAHGDLVPLAEKLRDLSTDEIAQLPGVSAERAHQLYVGTLVADATMSLFGLDELEICPWALREGVLLERIDHL